MTIHTRSRIIRNGLASLGMLVASALPTLAAAQQAACWNQSVTEAAQVRQFDLMLMVSALRCQVKGVDIVPDYNAFVNSQRTVLTAFNDEIRHQFNATMGGRAALDAYDRLGTAMANQFGNGGAITDCEELRTLARAAAAMEPSRHMMVALAQRLGMEPPIPGKRCEGRAVIAATPEVTPAEARPVQLARRGPAG